MGGTNQTPQIDPTAIIGGLSVDQETKANLWDAAHSAKNEAELQVRLQTFKIPDEAKASLWDWKKMQGMQQQAPLPVNNKGSFVSPAEAYERSQQPPVQVGSAATAPQGVGVAQAPQQDQNANFSVPGMIGNLGDASKAMQRVKDMFSHSIFAYGTRSQSSPYVGRRDPGTGTVSKILGEPEQLAESGTRMRGALQAIGNVATVDNAVIAGALAATGGFLGPIAPATTKVLSVLTGGGFTLQMAEGLYRTHQAYRDAVDHGDLAAAKEIQGSELVQAGLTGLSAFGTYEAAKTPVAKYQGVGQSRPISQQTAQLPREVQAGKPRTEALASLVDHRSGKVDPYAVADNTVEALRNEAAKQGIKTPQFKGREGGQLGVKIANDAVNAHEDQLNFLSQPYLQDSVDMTPIAKAYASMITEDLVKNAPDTAQELLQEAQHFNRTGTLNEVNQLRERMNKELSTYYRKGTSQKIMSDVHLKAAEDAVQAARKIQYEYVGDKNAIDPASIKEMMDREGHLIEVASSLDKEYNSASKDQARAVTPKTAREYIFGVSGKPDIRATRSSFLQRTFGVKPMDAFNYRMRTIFDNLGSYKPFSFPPSPGTIPPTGPQRPQLPPGQYAAGPSPIGSIIDSLKQGRPQPLPQGQYEMPQGVRGLLPPASESTDITLHQPDLNTPSYLVDAGKMTGRDVKTGRFKKGYTTSPREPLPDDSYRSQYPGVMQPRSRPNLSEGEFRAQLADINRMVENLRQGKGPQAAEPTSGTSQPPLNTQGMPPELQQVLTNRDEGKAPINVPPTERPLGITKTPEQRGTPRTAQAPIWSEPERIIRKAGFETGIAGQNVNKELGTITFYDKAKPNRPVTMKIEDVLKGGEDAVRQKIAERLAEPEAKASKGEKKLQEQSKQIIDKAVDQNKTGDVKIPKYIQKKLDKGVSLTSHAAVNFRTQALDYILSDPELMMDVDKFRSQFDQQNMRQAPEGDAFAKAVNTQGRPQEERGMQQVREDVENILEQHANGKSGIYPKELVDRVVSKVPPDLLANFMDARAGRISPEVTKAGLDSIRGTLGAKPKGFRSRGKTKESGFAAMDIPSAIGEAGKRLADMFFSKAQKTAEEKLPNKMPASMVEPTLRNNGVPEEQIHWLELNNFLKDKKVLTKQELLDYMKQNDLKVEVMPLGAPTRTDLEKIQNLQKELDSNIERIHELVKTGLSTPESLAEFNKLDENEKRIHNELAYTKGSYGTNQYVDYGTGHLVTGGLTNHREILLKVPDVPPLEVHPAVEAKYKEKLDSLNNKLNELLAEQAKLQNLYENTSDSVLETKYWRELNKAKEDARDIEAQRNRIRGRMDDESRVMRPGMTSNYADGHYYHKLGVKNVVAHTRLGDRFTPDPEGPSTINGVKGWNDLHIDEGQSDLHHYGREKGYLTKKDLEQRSNLYNEKYAARQDMRDMEDKIKNHIDAIGAAPNNFADTIGPNYVKDLNDRGYEIRQEEKDTPYIYDKEGNYLSDEYDGPSHDREMLRSLFKKRSDYINKFSLYHNGDFMDYARAIALDPEYAAHADGINDMLAKHKDSANRIAAATGKLAAMEEKSIPDAPFKNWHELLLKYLMRYAAEHGYDRMTWTTGMQQAERYNVANYIKRITYEPRAGDKTALWVEDKNGGMIHAGLENQVNGSEWDSDAQALVVPNKELANIAGQEIADKIKNGHGEISGEIHDVEPEKHGLHYVLKRKSDGKYYSEGENSVPQWKNRKELADAYNERDMKNAMFLLKNGESTMSRARRYSESRELPKGIEIVKQKTNYGDEYYDIPAAEISGHYTPQEAKFEYWLHEIQKNPEKYAGVEDTGQRTLNNLDIQTGGKFHKQLYDVMWPSFLKKYTKKWGNKIGDTTVPVGEDDVYAGERVAALRFIDRYLGEDMYNTPEADSKLDRLNTGFPGTADKPFTHDEIHKKMQELRNSDNFHDDVRSNFYEDMRKWMLERMGFADEKRDKKLPMHYIEVNPKMREDVLYKGQPIAKKKLPATIPPKVRSLIEGVNA